MTDRILGIILPVFSIIAVGYLWGRRVRPDMAMVNRISMNVLAPALIFSALSSKAFDVRDGHATGRQLEGADLARRDLRERCDPDELHRSRLPVPPARD